MYAQTGIGVDDIFVIVQTWDNVAGSINDKEPIPEKVSRTMKHAVSIFKTILNNQERRVIHPTYIL